MKDINAMFTLKETKLVVGQKTGTKLNLESEMATLFLVLSLNI